MKESFDKLYTLLRADRELSSWSSKLTLQDRAQELKGEVDELIAGLEQGDMANFEEEVGDVLWDLMSLIIVAEDQGLFDTKKVIMNSIDKISRRKPFLITGNKVTYEEEVRVWREAKEKEKK